jgi:hypothetical protein
MIKELPDKFPKIVCLCGSTRFKDEFMKQYAELSDRGCIVLTVARCIPEKDEVKATKLKWDELHKRKIDLADEVLVLNVGGYIGESTRSEIEYAKAHGKPIRYLETPTNEYTRGERTEGGFRLMPD